MGGGSPPPPPGVPAQGPFTPLGGGAPAKRFVVGVNPLALAGIAFGLLPLGLEAEYLLTSQLSVYAEPQILIGFRIPGFGLSARVGGRYYFDNTANAGLWAGGDFGPSALFASGTTYIGFRVVGEAGYTFLFGESFSLALGGGVAIIPSDWFVGLPGIGLSLRATVGYRF
jgi:hypothetical protein